MQATTKVRRLHLKALLVPRPRHMRYGINTNYRNLYLRLKQIFYACFVREEKQKLYSYHVHCSLQNVFGASTFVTPVPMVVDGGNVTLSR